MTSDENHNIVGVIFIIAEDANIFVGYTEKIVWFPSESFRQEFIPNQSETIPNQSETCVQYAN